MPLVKRQRSVVWERGPTWKASLRSPFNRALVDFLRELPGCSWDRAENVWHVPQELKPVLQAWTTKASYQWRQREPKGEPRPTFFGPVPEGLRPWQAETWDRLHFAGLEGGYLASYETGLGKTRLALEVLRAKGGLVLCPAGVVPVWQAEAAKWGLPAPHILTVTL